MHACGSAYAHVRAYLSVCMHTCLHRVPVSLRVYVLVHVRVYVCTRIHICVCVCVFGTL